LIDNFFISGFRTISRVSSLILPNLKPDSNSKLKTNIFVNKFKYCSDF